MLFHVLIRLIIKHKFNKKATNTCDNLKQMIQIQHVYCKIIVFEIVISKFKYI